MCGRQPCYVHTKAALSQAFARYGEQVGRRPFPFLVLPLLVVAGLGAGLLKIEALDYTDDVHSLRNSRARQDQAKVQQLFPDRTADSYDAVELNEDQIMAVIIFRGRHNASVYDTDALTEIRQTLSDVRHNVTARLGNVTYTYDDLCGRRYGVCVVTGERLLSPQFDAMRRGGGFTYPKWRLPNNETVDFSFALADADSRLQRVGVIRVTFKLRHDLKNEAFAWEDAFLEFAMQLRLNYTEMAFSTSQSFRQEREKSVQADYPSLWAGLGAMTCFAWLVTAGGDMVSTRALMLVGGMVTAALGVVAAAGLLSACGVRLVHLLPLATFLVLGISFNNTFLLMSCWSETLQNVELGVQQRVGVTLSRAGTAIVVTSLSSGVSLAIGYTSIFIAVSSLCVFLALALVFSCICHMTLLLACLTLHGRRTYASRHALTCRRIKPRNELRQDGRLSCCFLCCGGSVPSAHREDESLFEKLPRKALTLMAHSAIAKVTAIVLFLGFTATAVYGVTTLQQGVGFKTLVARSSYFFDYITTDADYFGFSFPIAFVIGESTEYNLRTAHRMGELIQTAKDDRLVEDEFSRCWLTDFVKSSFFDPDQAGGNFTLGAVQDFLINNTRFLTDVVFDETGLHIIASRCFVFSEKNSDQRELASLMQRVRRMTQVSDLPVFAFHPSFLRYEQFLWVLPTTLQSVGVATVVLCVVQSIFLPHPLVTALVVVDTLSSTVQVLGFMALWDVNLSSDTMAHVVMAAVLAVHLSTHVCCTFLTSSARTRSGRTLQAAGCAAVPDFNFGLSSLIGLLVLLSAHSYLFVTFFKVMVLAFVFGIFNGVFFTTAVLALVGPEDVHLRSESEQQHINSHQQGGKETASQPIPAFSNRTLPSTKTSSQNQSAFSSPKFCGSTTNWQDAEDYRILGSRMQDQNTVNGGGFSRPPQWDHTFNRPGYGTHQIVRSPTPYYVPVLPPRLGCSQKMLGSHNEFENIIRYHKHQSNTADVMKTGLVAKRQLLKMKPKHEHSSLAGPKHKPGQTAPHPADTRSFLQQSFTGSAVSAENVHGVAATLSKRGSLASSQAYIVETLKDGR